MNQLSFTKTRIAPTPSGYLHLGNAMSFLVTATLAKQVNAKLLLRIDDMDKERVQKKYVEDIFDTLHFLEIEWQEGPENYTDYEKNYTQNLRLALYEQALQQLREEGLVFGCRCSRMQLQNGSVCNCRENKIPLDQQDTSWRLITDEPLSLKVISVDNSCLTALLPSSMKSFIVRKKNGFPSYQLTSLIDDEFFGVDAIVRGQDLWDSTLAQQYVALLLNKTFFQSVIFHHHPLLMNAEGTDKLSKSAGASSVLCLRSAGKTKTEIISLLENFCQPRPAGNRFM